MSVANQFERQMLGLINEERTSRGIDPLTLELRLNDASEDHSTWMETTGAFSHTGAGGSSAGDRMEDAGFVFSGSWTWGENIAYQSERGAPGISDDVADLHTSLMNSPGHRANILNPDFEMIGIGIETGDNRGFDAVYVTQNFARTSAPVQADTGGPSNPGPAPEPGSQNDILIGGAGSDRLDGMAGNDEIVGRGGADVLFGRGGRDTLDGGAGTDRLSGGLDGDIVRGGTGNDTLFGDGGHDRLLGGSGNDRHFGGAGGDTVHAGEGMDYLHGETGNDRLFGGAGGDTVHGGNGIDHLHGGNGNDRLFGGAGYDTLNGGNGTDHLYGGNAHDVLNGGDGRDLINGGAGNDTLTGGNDADVFVWSRGRDTVRDFDQDEPGEVIDLRTANGIASFQDLVSGGHLEQSGSSTVIEDAAGNAMVLIGIAIEDLGASDFLF